MQYYNGTATPSDLQEYLADVNGDGRMDASDVLLINQISVGLVD